MAYDKTPKKRSQYADRKDHKIKKIQDSLSHRARLRKNYFKLLKREGLDDGNDEKNQEEKDINNNNGRKFKSKVSNKESSKEEGQNNRLNFSERVQKVKERKERMRELQLDKIKSKKQSIMKSKQDREDLKTKLNQKTRSGQPLMAPRINHLLDKIKQDMDN